ncbi:MAG: succinate dehydrogenase cytochrome b subunit [Merismopedia sp. SIO2A8]|nr:succinate dehydrogenase cytochrome b subunit [Merismopedia sp. SIO2A8]
MTTASSKKITTKTNSLPGRALYRSPIGKKILTGITGVGLVVFIIAHLLGNLLLFVSPGTYNAYGHALERLGPVLWLIEIVLLLVIVGHASLGIQIYLNSRRARTTPYQAYQSAGKPSHQTLSSRTMIWSGLTLAIFVVWHLATFKFGPYQLVESTTGPVRDLASLVFDAFRKPLYTVSYTLLLGLLGAHLRHGIWSALQSLGVLGGQAQVSVARLSTGLAASITIGFLAVPWAIYWGWLG